MLVVSACGGEASTPAHHPLSLLSGQYSYTPAPSRVPGGKVTFAMRGFPTALNPLFSSSLEELEVSAALWSAPVVYDEQFHVQPDQLTEVPLPENGDVQDGGKTIIMHLRHDLRWSDGQPILASDFQYWWHLDQDADTGAITTSGYDQIASIDAPDRFTVVLHMKHAFGPYLLYLPYAAPQHVWGKFRPIDLQNLPQVYQAPAVTDGPYKLARFVDQQSYTLEPDPYYTSTTFHGPFLSQLVYQAYDSLSALSAAVREERVDVTGGYMEYELPALAHLPSAVKMSTTPALRLYPEIADYPY
jgi:peptide/nickel transport system substrate-binding protein